MPIVAASNGVRPEYRALAVIKLNKSVTPKEINDYVGTGDYAAKYISFLRRDGFVFDCTKDGRRIVSYTLVAEPKNAEYFRNMQPKSKAAAPAKTAKTVKVVAVAKPAAKNLAKAAAAKVPAKKSKVDAVEKTFGSTGEIASSYAVDNGWDSMDNVDVKDFLR
jgi:hypothetical protein